MPKIGDLVGEDDNTGHFLLRIAIGGAVVYVSARSTSGPLRALFESAGLADVHVAVIELPTMLADFDDLGRPARRSGPGTPATAPHCPRTTGRPSVTNCARCCRSSPTAPSTSKPWHGPSAVVSLTEHGSA